MLSAQLLQRENITRGHKDVSRRNRALTFLAETAVTFQPLSPFLPREGKWENSSAGRIFTA